MVQLTEDVVTGKLKNAVAVVRPPGHHAESTEAMGFCLFNNVGVAAEVVKRKHGVKRILIVDWDVHHGNATQNMFLEDPSVLYVSLHRFDNGGFYPGQSGSPTIIGSKGGRGKNVNIGWNTRNVSDGAYLAAFNLLLLPIFEEYKPELVIISAGFDSAEGDPLGGIKVTPGGYAHMTKMLMGVCDKVVVVLEGGYNITSISLSMAAVVSTLLGETPAAARDPDTLDSSCLNSIFTTLKHHQNHWEALKGMKIPEMKQLSSPVKSPAKPAPAASASPASSPSKPPTSSAASAPSSSASGAEDPEHFAVWPLKTCPHVSHSMPVPDEGVDIKKACADCGGMEENWLCLTCYQVGCSRYQKGHMKAHFEAKGHAMALSFSDLSVWCFVCNSYLDNPAFKEVIGHSLAQKE